MDEFNIKLASNATSKKFSVFRLHKDDEVNWSETKMRRENENQPWQIKSGSGRAGRRFKAIKEGGVSDNAAYFAFYRSKDKSNTYEVCPIEDWYSLSATQRYKTLTAEEAEAQFQQRMSNLSKYATMYATRSKDGGPKEDDDDRDQFKVFGEEMDNWSDGDDDMSNGEEGDNGDKKSRKKSNKKDKDDPENAPDEAKEESDEGDFEQREVDYMSDSSSSDSEPGSGREEDDVKGIAEENALRDLLSSDDEDDEQVAAQKVGKAAEVNRLGVSDGLDADADDSDDSSDSDDYDVDPDKIDSMMDKKIPNNHMIKSEYNRQDSDTNLAATAASHTAQASGSKPTSSAAKRKAAQVESAPNPIPAPRPSKRPAPPEVTPTATNAQEKIVEDLIRKYLSRKPMTLKQLLKDIKSKLKRMEGVTPEMDLDLVNTIALIIKRLQPDKQKINEITYLSLKS